MCAVVALARRRTVAAVLHQWKLWNFSAHPRFGQVSLHASIIISTASQRQTLGPTDRQLLETLFGGWWETIENDLPIHECVDYITWTSSNTIYQKNIKKVLSNSKSIIFHRQSPNIYLSILLSLLYFGPHTMFKYGPPKLTSFRYCRIILTGKCQGSCEKNR